MEGYFSAVAQKYEILGLPYLQDLFDERILNNSYPVLKELHYDLVYDSKSAFTLSINHRDTTQELQIQTDV